jgi:hypothetical protein
MQKENLKGNYTNMDASSNMPSTRSVKVMQATEAVNNLKEFKIKKE